MHSFWQFEKLKFDFFANAKDSEGCRLLLRKCQSLYGCPQNSLWKWILSGVFWSQRQRYLFFTIILTSSIVRLPAPNHQVKEFSFGTPYETIISELKAIDEDWYSSRSIMYIMERNAEIKEAPEHFQDCDHIDQFDLILCCDNYCYNVAKTCISFYSAQ